jgi:hypothetical protein
MPFVVENGYRIFTDLEGQPLDGGYIFIGEDGLNPLTNPQTAYFDEALSIPAENIRTSGGYAVYRGSPATIYTLNDYSILVQDKNQQTVYYNPSVSALEVGPVSLDLSTLANGYLPIGFAAPDTGVTFPGFVAAGTENLSATLYPELYAQVASQDFLSDNGDGTFNVLNTGLDTGWVSNSSWQAATFTILHSLNQALSNLEISFEVSELGTDNTAIRPLDVAYDAASGADAVKGVTYHGSNSNQFLVKTGTNGIDYIATDGSRATLTTQSWFYRIKVKRKDMPYPAQIKAQVLQNGDALTTLMNETGWTANSDWTAATFTFIHSLDILSPFVEFWISTDGTWENAFKVDSATQTTSSSGVTFFIRDNNTVEVQTATNGIYVATDNDTIAGTPGAPRSIQTESWFYNIIVYKPQLITNITESTAADGLLGLDLVAVEYSAPNILVKVGSKIEANGIVYTVQGSDVSLTAADGNLCYNPVSGFFIDNVETPVYAPAKGGYYINTNQRVSKWNVTSDGDYAHNLYSGESGKIGQLVSPGTTTVLTNPTAGPTSTQQDAVSLGEFETLSFTAEYEVRCFGSMSYTYQAEVYTPTGSATNVFTAMQLLDYDGTELDLNTDLSGSSNGLRVASGTVVGLKPGTTLKIVAQITPFSGQSCTAEAQLKNIALSVDEDFASILGVSRFDPINLISAPAFTRTVEKDNSR